MTTTAQQGELEFVLGSNILVSVFLVFKEE